MRTITNICGRKKFIFHIELIVIHQSNQYVFTNKSTYQSDNPICLPVHSSRSHNLRIQPSIIPLSLFNNPSNKIIISSSNNHLINPSIKLINPSINLINSSVNLINPSINLLNPNNPSNNPVSRYLVDQTSLTRSRHIVA